MHLMMLLIRVQIKECIEAAKEVVNTSQQDGGAWPIEQGEEKNVKVRIHCIGQHGQIVEAMAVVLYVYVKMSYYRC